MLNDDKCNEFRRMNVSFNDMVRAIYEAGYYKGVADMEVLVKMKMDYIENNKERVHDS